MHEARAILAAAEDAKEAEFAEPVAAEEAGAETALQEEAGVKDPA